MTTSKTRAAALCALLATTCLSVAIPTRASAQSAFDVQERKAPDENGIDVISGTINAPLRSITAGRPGQGGLTYMKGWSGGSTFDTFLTQINKIGTQPLLIKVFGSAKHFTDNGDGTWSNVDGDGATFVYDSGIDGYIYTAHDGTVVTFLKSLGNPGLVTTLIARASTIERPNGEIITYNYTIKQGSSCTGFPCTVYPGDGRVESITSNLGYQLKGSYATNTWTPGGDNSSWRTLTKVVAINNAVDYCTPFASGCSFTQAWPELSLASTTSGSTTTSTATGNLSDTTTAVSGASGLTSITSPANSSADFTLTYDASNRVATYARGGGTWTYTYSDSGNIRTTTVTQPLGGSKVYTSDLTLKRVMSIKDELNRTTSFQYDSFGRLTRTTMPEGNYTELTYDGRGNVTQTLSHAKTGSGLTDIVTSAVFPSTCTNPKTCNEPTSTTDARGKTTDYTYDATHGGLLTVTAPAPTTGAVRPQTRYSYSALTAYYKNSAGTIVAAPSSVYRLANVSACQTTSSCNGTADEVEATIAYGSTGVANNLLPTSVAQGAGDGSLTATTATTYDAFGNVLTVDGPLAGTADTIRYRYDANQQLVGTVSADPDGAGALKNRAQKLLMDANGNPTKIMEGSVASQSDADWSAFSPTDWVEIGYDSLGRKVRERMLAGSVVTPTVYGENDYSYDIKGRPDCSAQRLTLGAYSTAAVAACSLTSPVGAAGPDRISKTIYDNADEVTQVQTGLGTTDQRNAVTNTYSSNGQLATVKDGENNLTTYEYDGFDRLTKTRYPSPTKGAGTSSTSDYEQPGYDAGSNVTSYRLRDTTSIAFTYDNLNRLTLKNLPGTEPDVSYTYDNLGRMTGASQTGNALTFTYDALGRNLTQVGPLGTATSAWDLAGRRTQLTYPGTGLYVNYDYLVTGEVSKIRENGATTGIGVLAMFGYDDLGRRATLTYGNGVVTSYGFDAVSRLASLTQNLASTANDLTLGFSYNPASQIVSSTRSNDLFAWTGHGSGTTAATANGLNQLAGVGGVTPTYDSKGNMTGDGVKAFGYSSENLLTSASGSVSLSYDPGMRLYQTVGSTTTRFAYDGADMIAEYNNSNALQRRYVHGPGTDEPLVWYEGSGTTDRRFLQADERGSIVAVTGSTGAPITGGINKYDEYGVPQGTLSGRFGYTGQEWIPELGLYYYKARMYHPKLARFMQTDPIGYGSGMNLYAYVGDDPVNLVDSSGLFTVTGPPCPGGSHPVKGRGNARGCVANPLPRPSVNPNGPNIGNGPPNRAPTPVAPMDGDTRCYATAKQFADQLQGVGNGLQTAGKIMTGIGLAGDLAAVFFPPAELVTGGFTALGVATNRLGNAISGSGAVLDFIATGNYQRAALNGIGFVAGKLSSSGDAHEFARGVALDAAVNGKEDQMHTSCSPGR